MMSPVSVPVVTALSTVLCLVASAVPLGQQKTFGHAIKNGNLPPNTDVTTFEHRCTVPPCVITHVNVPSIYPKGGDAWNWTQGHVFFFVDGEKQPSISLTLLELAGEGHWNLAGTNAQSGDHMPDGSPWGTSLMGRTAKSGGVYSTLRVPFGKSIRTAIRAPASATQDSVFWFVIRGLEAHVVRLGDLELPAAARLRLHRLSPTKLEKLQLVDLASSPKGTSGALVRVQLDARSGSFGFLEACMRFFPDGAGEDEPIFLSSGAEDYFLGASYFDEGMFKTSQAGLTYFNRSSYTLAAYKTHIEDPVLWRDGMRLRFRNCEDTEGCGDVNHCPNKFCSAAASESSARSTEELPRAGAQHLKRERGSDAGDLAEYSALVFSYEWPRETSNFDDRRAMQVSALRNLGNLVSKAKLNEALEDAATVRILEGEEGVLSLLLAFSQDLSEEAAKRLARQLARRIQQTERLTQI
ncbi:unnamed protein product [Symbiodinium necroappetens]|uniref:Uncharacterized protein n=1 Tax=Symbiodinium necroappetens TaxID=1628268 RepID=A0A813B1T1_9DINO|nr:unnamed protein product [Symbiodinium necroappetens]